MRRWGRERRPAGPRPGSGSGRGAGLRRPLPGRAAVTQPPPHHTHPSPGFPRPLRLPARTAVAAGRPGRPRGLCGDSVRPDCGGWGGKPGAALPPREPCRRRGETRTLGWRRWRRGRERAEPRRPVRSAKPEEARHPRPRPKHTPRRERRVGAAGKGRARGGGREEGTCHTPLFSSASGSGGGRPSKCLYNNNNNRKFKAWPKGPGN